MLKNVECFYIQYTTEYRTNEIIIYFINIRIYHISLHVKSWLIMIHSWIILKYCDTFTTSWGSYVMIIKSIIFQKNNNKCNVSLPINVDDQNALYYAASCSVCTCDASIFILSRTFDLQRYIKRPCHILLLKNWSGGVYMMWSLIFIWMKECTSRHSLTG